MLDPLFRYVILDALKSIKTQAGRTLLSGILKGSGSKIKNRIHPNIERIHSDLKKDHPSLSKTTVYNVI